MSQDIQELLLYGATVLVLFLFLFSLYTADCRSSHDDCIIVKFVDDTAMMGKVTDDDDAVYQIEIKCFAEWCDKYHLKLNIHKTKELVIDPRKNKAAPSPVMIKGVEIERVVTYKYLGIVIDNSLQWVKNTDAILKKVHTRLYLPEKVKIF